MFANRHPLLWTFAGGCLSGAVVIGVVFIGVVREDAETVPPDAPSVRTSERDREPTPAERVNDGESSSPVADDDSNRADDAPALPRKKAELDGDHPTDEGHSIADILSRLEAAYRKDFTAPPAATTTPAHAPPPQVPAPAETAVAVVAPAPAPTTVPAAVAPPPAAPPPRAAEADTRPLLVAARDEAPTTNVFNGNVQQNTNVGSVQQGDVYVMPSVVPYAPYYARQNPPRYVPPANAPSPGIPRAVHFTRNPNPAGSGVFNYSFDGPFKYPVDLVH
jgi:hypothetical protein